MASFLVLFAVIAVHVARATPDADRCGATATSITPFDVDEYLGIWYQIAVNKGFEELFERRYPLWYVPS